MGKSYLSSQESSDLKKKALPVLLKKGKKPVETPLFEADEIKAEKEAVSSGGQLPSSAMGKYFSHPDKKTRDKAVAVFSKWIARQEHLSDDEYVKVWKALFYCYWMSDKGPVQRELAERLAALINVCRTQEQTERFLRAFYTTMQREWAGIDRLRMDKFYNLIRCFARETFVYLARSRWEHTRIARVNAILSDGPLGLSAEGAAVACKNPGLQLHLVDILLEEITEALNEGITPDSWLAVLEPYMQLLSTAVDKSVFLRVYERVFQALAGKKWLASSLAGEEDEEEAALKSKPLRHANRMFRHTKIEPLPAQNISEHFAGKAFAAEIAHAMTSRIFELTIDPNTWEFGRRYCAR